MSRVPPLQFRREDLPDLSTGERTDKLIRGLNAFGAEAETTLNGGLTFKENFKAFAKELKFTAEEDWVAITPTAPWAAGSPAPSVRKRGARVELRGILTVGAATTGSTAFVLPATCGSAAAITHLFPISALGAFGAHLGLSTATGIVHFVPGVTSVVLDGAAWDAENTTDGANGVFPVSIKNELSGTPAPSHVWVTQLVDVTDSRAVSVAPGGLAWSVSRDQIVIRDIANVYAGRKYKCTILVVAE